MLIEVVKINSLANSVIIRPNHSGIRNIKTVSAKHNKKVRFTLAKPAKLSVEFNDDPDNKDALMIFADALENPLDIPVRKKNSIFYVSDSVKLNNISIDKSIVYFKPGIYKIDYWNIPSFVKQVYIEGGAFLTGYLNKTTNASIKINGRGILSNDGYAYHYPSVDSVPDNDNKKWYYPISLNGGENNTIEGITIIESTAYCIMINANNTLIQNVKMNGFRYNNDGITIIGKGNKINDCFMRLNDDAIVPYASDLTVSNCIFWQLQGSVFQLGWYPHSMNNINISNCDIIHDKATNSDGNVGFINAMNYLQSNGTAVVEDLKASNIYFDTPVLRFLDIRCDRNFKLKDYPADSVLHPWVYKNFSFSNIHFNSINSKYPLIYLHGFNGSLPLTNFTFKNIYIRNTKIKKAKFDTGLIVSSKNASNIEIK